MTPLSSALSLSNGLLLCIDLQPVFLAAICDSQRVHWRCSFAIETAKGLGLPIVFTEQVPAKLGHTADDLLALVQKPVALGKDAFSALGDRQIAAHLHASGAKHLLICGIETPVCVYQTARDAQQAGYEVTVLVDGVGARRSGDASAVLARPAAPSCQRKPFSIRCCTTPNTPSSATTPSL
jgi:nicotinamidase-related amidase